MPSHDLELYTEAEVAKVLRLCQRQVLRLRQKGIGPTPVILPGMRGVRYRRSDVVAWLDLHRAHRGRTSNEAA